MTIYIKEAHPEDEWQMDNNESEDVCYLQPASLEQRINIANDFIVRHAYPIPMLVDQMDNRANEAYSAWPERLYIVTPDGKIAYKGGVGPFGFKPVEVEQWLETNLKTVIEQP